MNRLDVSEGQLVVPPAFMLVADERLNVVAVPVICPLVPVLAAPFEELVEKIDDRLFRAGFAGLRGLVKAKFQLLESIEDLGRKLSDAVFLFRRRAMRWVGTEVVLLAVEFRVPV